MNSVENQFKLLKNIVNLSKTADLKVDLSEIENFIFKELPQALEKNAPINFPELYFDFKGEYERFKEFVLYENLIGKNVIALGGGFSSGKSTFLNSLMDEDILPSRIDPSTSVPAYIVYDDEISVYGINTFQSKVEMHLEDVSLLSHGFGKGVADNKEITLGHLLSSLFISTPKQIFKNIALLDTPGYSKADSISYSSKTDEKIARVQLNSSNYIMWFVQADSGTITEADISFIKTLREDIPKLIIVNKADKVMPDELDEIINKIKDTLNIKGIKYLDVLAYSSDEPDDYDKDKILEYMQLWNNGILESRFAYNFKVLFSKCRDYYDELLDQEKKQHSRLSHILADVSLENVDAKEYLEFMNNSTKKHIAEIKDLKENLKMLQNKFFTEIKRISDIVHIDMPEPSEIDLLQDRISNAKDILDEYRNRFGLNDIKHKNTINDLSMEFSKIFEEFNPVFNDICGGTNYSKQLVETLTDILQINVNDIHVNDCFNLNTDMIYNILGGNPNE